MTASPLHIASTDIRGGAAIAAYRLHKGLKKIGMPSRMLVALKESDDPDVELISPDRRLPARVLRRLAHERRAAEFKPYLQTLSPHLELFSYDYIPGPDPLSSLSLKPDIFNLHWTSGFLDYQRFFQGVSETTPIVWTLHDMNPMTGGCHYSLGCDLFADSCGTCFQIGSKSANDPSRKILERKTKALKVRNSINTHIVATSNWMAAEAKRSALFGRFPVSVIPYGLDVDIFRPRLKEFSKEFLNLPQDRAIVLFVADNIKNHRKGFDLLQVALSSVNPALNIQLVAIGDNANLSCLPNGTIGLGRIEDQRVLSMAYSAADVFVMPTRAEAFGQVVFEAMACGTPIVAFNVGGIPDMVRQEETGLLVQPEDSGGLARAIERILLDDDLRRYLSSNCRQTAVAEYALEIQASRYVELYEKLLEVSKNHSESTRG